ncbi:hypothetical protein [Methylobacterium gnaphalii]|uniref:HEPN AbiU2-like domain-containing protein n=1 Tax=Methylobacterium gnaphalii TaxID=1010610 RepID=A0A512JRJ3_9HYPH|nr:hypothetical protein [Methylobacterium gnaphalii]GEP12577.1 hypothetical protein MGN01_44220 [Methylobacterium gnaphalii]GLS47194.1 hypothetical protein GCM10007885_00360 [Methylobacterium gnaphalii]
MEAMLRAIEFDINVALWDEAVLEKDNDIIRGLEDRQIDGASVYNVIHQGLAADLSVTLWRLYDLGSKRFKPNKRETSSIPLLIRLVRQKRCTDYYIDQAKNWSSAYSCSELDAHSCEQAIKKAVETYNSPMKGRGPSSFKKLQAIRNYRIAHRKIDDVNKCFLRYKDLFEIIEPAVIITENLKLATTGHNLSLAE